MSGQLHITVVGAGVVGLTAAAALLEAGHDVDVIAAATGDATTSAVAGALWLPFHAGPPDAVLRWAARTRTWLESLAATTPAAGVDLLDVLVVDDGARPFWADIVGPLARVTTTWPGAPAAWRFRAPRVEPRLHLAWLEAHLPRPIRLERVARLGDVPGDVVINATGLGARALTGDPTLSGLFGQTVIVAPGDLDLSVSLHDDRDEAAMFYTIPRRGEIVVGGCILPRADDDPLTPDPEISARLGRHAAALGLTPGAVVRERAGLRPFRPTVRIERDPDDARVIHAYGHGGAGYTLARGCAEDLVTLVSDASTGTP